MVLCLLGTDDMSDSVRVCMYLESNKKNVI